MQIRLNVLFKSVTTAVSKTFESNTTATKDSTVEINENFRIFFL